MDDDNFKSSKISMVELISFVRKHLRNSSKTKSIPTQTVLNGDLSHRILLITCI